MIINKNNKIRNDIHCGDNISLSPSTDDLLVGTTTKQLNLKISKKLMKEVEVYSDEFGYNNAQELIREAIRDKIYGSDIVRTDYLERLFTDKEFQISIGKKQSSIELEELRKRITNG